MLISQILKSIAFQTLEKVLGLGIRLSDSFPLSFSQYRQNLSTDCQNVPRSSNQKGSNSGQAFFFFHFSPRHLALPLVFTDHCLYGPILRATKPLDTCIWTNSCLLVMIDLSIIIIVMFMSQRVHNYIEQW